MKPFPSSDHDEHERNLLKRLKDLVFSGPEYPPDLLSARRAAFIEQLEELGLWDTGEVLSTGDREIEKLLGTLKSIPEQYPAQLLAARRTAFLDQMARTEAGASLLEQLRGSLQQIFQRTTTPAAPSPELRRLSLVAASLVAAVMIGTLFFARAEQASQPSPSQAAAAPTDFVPASSREVSLTICNPEDQASSCPPGELSPGQDLADPGNGLARPAVSKDARTGEDGVHEAAYVNDGRGGQSWMSDSANSWIKIDLGEVTAINTVSLQKGNSGSSTGNDPGQFVIAVALSDVYADGDSSHDYAEYAEVFRSEQTGFSGRVSHAEVIKTEFSPVQARFVKVTFENAGAAIEKVGVFMIEPPVLAQQPTSISQDNLPEIPFSPARTETPSPVDTAASGPIDTAVSLPTDTPTQLPTHTRPPANTSTLLPTNTGQPSSTPTQLPTSTLPPSNTSTPVPSNPLPTTAPTNSEPIVVTGNGQTLTFTCNDHDAEIRGHSNTVTLLGSCRSITVTGNGNSVFWQYGSPIITDRGNDNLIQQL